MSKTALPDVIGLQLLRANGGANAPRRHKLDLRGEVVLADNAIERRIDLHIGSPAIVNVTLDGHAPDFNPAGFATASIVRIVSQFAGSRITPTTTGVVTLRRTWLNVGSLPVEIVVSSGSHLLVAGRSFVTVFDPVALAWIGQTQTVTE